MDSTRTNNPDDVRSSRLRGWSIAMLGLLALSCIMLPVLAFVFRPPAIHSHEDQISYVLQRQGMTPAKIALGERWPDRVNIQYGTNVYPYGYRFTVLLDDGRQESGWLECAQREAKCTATILPLGFPKTPLPEFSSQQALPIPAWLQPYLRWMSP